MPEKISKRKYEMEGYSLAAEDRELIRSLAATSHEHNKSAALRAIIAEYRERWHDAFQTQEPTDADRDD